MIEFRLFGALDLRSDDGRVFHALVAQPKRLAILIYLCLARPRGFHRRDRLLGLLWPDSDQQHARTSLRNGLHLLRRFLGTETLTSRGDEELSVNFGALWCDVVAFEKAIEAGRFEDAASLYRGDLLPSFFVSDVPLFEHWLEAERARLRHSASRAAWALAEQYAAERREGEALQWTRRAMELSDDDEPSMRRGLDLLSKLGDRAGGLLAYEAFERRLRDEHDAVPSPETQQGARRLRESAWPQANAQRAELGLASGQRAGVISDESNRRRAIGRRPLFMGASIVVAVAVVAGFVAHRTSKPVLDDNLVAVAPFDVVDSSLGVWKEGLVDLLSHNLDGAGPLRAVPPTRVIKNWAGRAEPATAARLASRTSARWIIFGSLMRAGRDSARMMSTLFDARRNRVVAEMDGRESSQRIDRFGDSITVRALNELAGQRQFGTRLFVSFGSNNTQALKEFLRGEQYRRRFLPDSAWISYSRAVVLDSSFALAFWSRALVHAGIGSAMTSQDAADMFRAAQLNHGLTARDSLLIILDSVATALNMRRLPPTQVPRLMRLVNYAKSRYPNDPQMWERVGETWRHLGMYYNAPLAAEQTLAALARAIAVDSDYLEREGHVIDVGLAANDPARVLEFMRARLARAPDPRGRDAFILDAIARKPISDARVDSLLQRFPAIRDALNLESLPDSSEIAVRLLRRLLAREDIRRAPNDSFRVAERLAFALFRRGQPRAGLAADPGDPEYQTEAGLLGIGGEDSARRFLVNAAAVPPGRPSYLLAWLAWRHDTMGIDSISRLVAAQRIPITRPRKWQEQRFVLATAPGFRALARGDSATASKLLDAIPDSLCGFACTYVYMERIRLANAQRRFSDAYAWSRFMPEYDLYAYGPLFMLERAHAAEGLGKRGEAAAAYRYVVEAWRKPDPELRHFVEEATAGLLRVKAK